jgi:sugar/nucleoside kinase (ribokinase family)
MTELIIIGTIGYDNVETPFGKRERALGGSASYASVAASFFSQPGMVAIVGEDFEDAHRSLLSGKGIDLTGVKQVPGKTFAWGGKYEFDMNEAKTDFTDLNTLMEFDAALPEDYKDAKFVFLANTDPSLQMKVIEQLQIPAFIVMDTMNFWIDTKKNELLEVIKKVDVLLVNDGEARMLFGTASLVDAAKQALALGPKFVIIKKGEHGALLFGNGTHFSAPGYPLEVIKDPTGCGDCFAGGFIGHLAKHGSVDEKSLRKAVVYGSVVASFNAENFSLDRISSLTDVEIAKRFEEMKELRDF